MWAIFRFARNPIPISRFYNYILPVIFRPFFVTSIGSCPILTKRLERDGSFFGCTDQILGRWVVVLDVLLADSALCVSLGWANT